MTVIEILLLIAGAVIFALGFFIPEGKDKINSEHERGAFKEELQEITDTEIIDAKRRVRDIIDEEISMAHDTSVRSMEKITNEKIMAINEYGKTVTDEIDRNHKEVVFMYDMLNDKTTDIKNTIRKYESIEKAERSKKAAMAEKRTSRTASRSDSGESIHIPKMFAPSKSQTVPAAEPSDRVQVSNAAPKAAETAYSNNDIIRLHNSGMSDVEIARELKIGVGEVKLAISLGGGGGSNET